MLPVPLVIGAAGAGAWVYNNGVPKWVKHFAEYEGRGERSVAQNARLEPTPAVSRAPERIIIMPEQSNRSNRNWLFWSSTALVSLAVYYYYIHNSGTKKVINKVEETATETQDLVVECDENNEKRFEVLDEKMQERSDEMSTAIRGEQRAHFDVLQEQIYCVTQVCLQTLDAVAKGVTGERNDRGEFEHADHKLAVYAQSAQDKNEELFDKEQYLKKRDLHIEECRAQLGLRRQKGKAATTGAYTGRRGRIAEADDVVVLQTEGELVTGTPGGDYYAGSNSAIADESATAGRSNPYVRTLRSSLRPAVELEGNGSDEDTEELCSLLELQWIQRLELSAPNQFLIERYVDPVQKFVREKKKPIIGISLATFVAVKLIDWFIDSNSADSYDSADFNSQTPTAVV